jgi:hypothetical protein
VALVRKVVSEERIVSIFKMKVISEPGTTLKVTSNCYEEFTLKMEAIHFSETSVLTRSTLRHIPEEDVL